MLNCAMGLQVFIAIKYWICIFFLNCVVQVNDSRPLEKDTFWKQITFLRTK